jgi:hypothetical protein
MRCLLVTTQKGYVGASTAAAGAYDVLLNSPFLPWNTSAAWSGPIDRADNAATVAGYPLLCTSTGPYRSYRVFGSAITISISNESNTDDLYTCVAPYVGTAQANLTVAAQSKFAKSATVTYGGNAVRLSNSLSVAEISGDSPASVSVESGFGAAYNAYPTFLANWRVWWKTADASTNGGGIAIAATVVYDVVFENPQFDAATLDSVSEKDQFALQLHLKKVELAERAAQEQDSRLESLAVAALEEKHSSSSSSSAPSVLSSSSSVSSALKATKLSRTTTK